MSPTLWLSLSISRRRSLSRISPFPIPRGRCSRHPEPSLGIPRRYLKAFATGSLDCARDDRKVEARSRQLATQNLSRARERGIDVRADVVETDSIYEAGMKQHFHRLRLDAAEEKLSAFAIKFLERNLERVQPGGVNCRYGTYSKNHDAWHTQGAREGGLKLLRHAKEKRTFNPKNEHSFRNNFFANGIAPQLQLAFRRNESDLRDFFHSLHEKRARHR